MSNNFSNNNLHSLKSSNIDWTLIQNDMKLKLGKDIYESWLKKLTLLKNLIIISYYLYQPDLLEIGSPQGI